MSTKMELEEEISQLKKSLLQLDLDARAIYRKKANLHQKELSLEKDYKDFLHDHPEFEGYSVFAIEHLYEKSRKHKQYADLAAVISGASPFRNTSIAYYRFLNYQYFLEEKPAEIQKLDAGITSIARQVLEVTNKLNNAMFELAVLTKKPVGFFSLISEEENLVKESTFTLK